MAPQIKALARTAVSSAFIVARKWLAKISLQILKRFSSKVLIVFLVVSLYMIVEPRSLKRGLTNVEVSIGRKFEQNYMFTG